MALTFDDLIFVASLWTEESPAVWTTEFDIANNVALVQFKATDSWGLVLAVKGTPTENDILLSLENHDLLREKLNLDPAIAPETSAKMIRQLLDETKPNNKDKNIIVRLASSEGAVNLKLNTDGQVIDLDTGKVLA